MSVDYTLLQVDRIILHDIPRRTIGQVATANLSDVESGLSPDLKRFLQQKFVEALCDSPYDVRFYRDSDSIVPQTVLDHLCATERHIVPMSQHLAHRLAEVQPPAAPASLLAVADTIVGRHRGLAVAKIEREEGLNLNQVQDDEGRRTFELQHLRSLMFTGKTRLYKIAHFVLLGAGLDDVHGVAVDKQRGYVARQAIANYFLTPFLGCRLTDDPVVATKKWFDGASKFISSSISDPISQTNGVFALQTEMLSNRDDLSSRRFADEHLQGESRHAFVEHMERAGFDRSRAVVKDTQLVLPHLLKAEWKFSSGIQLIAKREAVDAHIQIESLEGGEVRAIVTDRLSGVRTK